jgi:hypothetical protein
MDEPQDSGDTRLTSAMLLPLVRRAGVLGITARGVVRVSLMMTT